MTKGNGQEQPSDENIVIRVTGLRTQFGSNVIHQDLDFSVRRGEVMGVVGGSGSGKSVLLRTIVGLIRPAAGAIEILGQRTDTLAENARERLMEHTGMLFQDGALFSSMTVAENVDAVLREHTTLPKELRVEIAELKIALAELPPDAANKYPSELSGGMRKRAGLARALALDPDILFLDEPTAGLDPITAARFDRLIRSLQDSLGVTVVLVTHDLDTLRDACDRISALIDKRVRVGTMAELMGEEDPWLHEYFHGSRGRAAISGRVVDTALGGGTMEIRANYLMVGAFVLLLFAGAITFAIWLAKVQFDVQFARYDIRFPGSVSGLRVGSSVNYRGIPIGEVISIGLAPDNVEEVVVTIKVSADTPVKTDTVASLEMQGITGGVLIQLSGGTQEAGRLLPPGPGRRAEIGAVPSKLQQLFEGAPELVTNFNVLVTRATNLFTDQNLAYVNSILANVDTFTGTLADRGGDIGTLIQDADQAMVKMRDAMASFERLGANLNERAGPLTDQAQETLAAIEFTLSDEDAEFQRLIGQWRDTGQSVEGLADELEAMIAENRKPIRDFTEEGLYELSIFIAEAREFVNGLNRVTRDIERDPARFLFGNQQQGYEAGN